eukprot:4357656-Pyramimonas_sp.AAC.1
MSSTALHTSLKARTTTHERYLGCQKHGSTTCFNSASRPPTWAKTAFPKKIASKPTWNNSGRRMNLQKIIRGSPETLTGAQGNP